MQDEKVLLTAIYREDGVKDLPSGSRGKFAQAIKAERVAGHTTEKAASLLNEAIELENEASDS